MGCLHVLGMSTVGVLLVFGLLFASRGLMGLG